MASRPTVGFDGEQFVNHLLDRIERNAVSARKAFTMFQQKHRLWLGAEETLRIAQAANRRHERDLTAAEAKISEWSEYAGQLRAAIDAIDSRALKSKRIVLPDWPTPFTREFPF